MSATSDQQPRLQSTNEHDNLSALLTHKLRHIPRNHIPSLQISDILHQTPRALHIANIPPDLQLSFFLRHHGTINCSNGKPIKNSEMQNIEITRAIWYYRLDATHQFQRYHDTVRWNIALFTALLADTDTVSRNSKTYTDTPTTTHTISPPTSKHQQQPRYKDTYTPLSPSARRFLTSYLAAVLEHHDSPHSFVHREVFLALWKQGAWDLFTGFSSGMKKMLKNEMKALMKDWEGELVYAMRCMSRSEYEVRVGRFVGSLVPGQRDEGVGGLRGSVVASAGAVEGRVESGGVGSLGERNDLLEALCVPLGEQGGDVVVKEEGVMVADLRYAIGVVRKVRARDILPVLMRLFPVEDGE